MEQCVDERIMVTFVEDGSPARKQGINVEDEVIEVNGQNLREINNSFNDVLEVMNSKFRAFLSASDKNCLCQNLLTDFLRWLCNYNPLSAWENLPFFDC